MNELDLQSISDSMIAGMLMHISNEVHHSHRLLVDEARRRLALRESKWISVEERLPEEGVHVLIAQKNGYQNVDLRRRDTRRWSTGAVITHWMPLPKLPGKEAQP